MTPTTVAYRDRAYGAARRHVVTLNEKRVLDCLQWCERKFGKATPSVVDLAKWVGCSVRTVIRATARLAMAGWLKVTSRTPHVGADGRWTRSWTNLYTIRMPRNPRSHRRDTGVTSIAASRSDSSGGRRSPGADRPPAPVRLTLVPDPEASEPVPEGRAGLDYVARIMRAIRTGRTNEIPDPAE